MTRKQCAKCPWKTTTDPHEIPGGYSVDKHQGLKNTIAEPGVASFRDNGRRMACHESAIGAELPCVGWLVNQLSVGNNIGLRLAVFSGQIDADVETVGPQHERFEDTIPKRRRRARATR